MKRNIILVITGILIINITLAVIFVHFVRKKAFIFIKNNLEENYINNETINQHRDLLDLTNEQVEILKSIDMRYDEIQDRYRKNIKILARELRYNIQKDEFNEKNIRKIMDRIDRERREIRILNMKEMFEMEKVFDERQRVKLKNFMKKMPD